MLKAASGSYKVHKHTPHKKPTHIYSCVLLLSNPVACSRAQTQLVHHFDLFSTLHSTHSPTHPSIFLLPCTFFGWTTMRKHNQSWLAGFFRGGVVYTCSLLFKKAEEKVRYCSSTSSLSVKNAEFVVTTSPTRKS